MLDGAHASRNRMPDRLAGIDMRADVLAASCRFDGRDLQLLGRELHVLDRISRRADAAGGHDFDVVGALAQLIARDPAHFVRPVDVTREEDEGIGVVVDVVAVIGDAAVIAMTAGLRQAGPTDEQARTRDETLGDRVADTDIGAADIAHRRKAAIEHRANARHRSRGHFGQG